MIVIHLTTKIAQSINLWRAIYLSGSKSLDWHSVYDINELLWVAVDCLETHCSDDILYVIEQPTIRKIEFLVANLNINPNQLLVVSSDSEKYESFGTVCRKLFLADIVTEKTRKE